MTQKQDEIIMSKNKCSCCGKNNLEDKESSLCEECDSEPCEKCYNCPHACRC